MLPGGNLPYGYMRKKGTIAIEPSEAEIVREIYKLACDDYSGQLVAEYLRDRVYRRRNGKLWTQRQVGRILNSIEHCYIEVALYWHCTLWDNYRQLIHPLS
jgi:Recombinase